MHRKRFGLYALALTILILPLTAFTFHGGSEPELAANPELSAFRNFQASRSDRLAINPELAVLDSFAVPSADTLPVNPELGLLCSFGVRSVDRLAANPELILVHSYSELVGNPGLLSIGTFDICGS